MKPINLTSADPKGGIVTVFPEHIVLLQRQNNIHGDDFTAVFFGGGMPPYAVKETQDEILMFIKEANHL